MTKIAIVSCYFQPNYGSMIQALATQMALDKLGYENETIDITGFSGDIRKKKLKYFFMASFTTGILFTKLGRVRNVIKKRLDKGKYSMNISLRNNKFKEFADCHFRLSNRYGSIEELSKLCGNNYSGILVGSDQLWLPGNIAADYYTLNWAPDCINTIAYATSFGQAYLPKNISKKASVFLKKIRHISVREESGKKLVEDLTGRVIPVVCDPTLLFTGEEWLEIQDKKPLINEKYIFCYFLGSNSIHRQFANRLKESTGYKIVILPHIDEFVSADEEISDTSLYDVDPGEFLNLIRNAEYICTDSFHCTVFSMQYEKEFFSFRRFSGKDKQSTNSRLDTLFNLAGIDGRLLVGDEDIKKYIGKRIDYKKVNCRLEKIRKESYEYLQTALENERNTDL